MFGAEEKSSGVPEAAIESDQGRVEVADEVSSGRVDAVNRVERFPLREWRVPDDDVGHGESKIVPEVAGLRKDWLAGGGEGGVGANVERDGGEEEGDSSGGEQAAVDRRGELSEARHGE